MKIVFCSAIRHFRVFARSFSFTRSSVEYRSQMDCSICDHGVAVLRAPSLVAILRVQLHVCILLASFIMCVFEARASVKGVDAVRKPKTRSFEYSCVTLASYEDIAIALVEVSVLLENSPMESNIGVPIFYHTTVGSGSMRLLYTDKTGGTAIVRLLLVAERLENERRIIVRMVSDGEQSGGSSVTRDGREGGRNDMRKVLTVPDDSGGQPFDTPLEVGYLCGEEITVTLGWSLDPKLSNAVQPEEEQKGVDSGLEIQGLATGGCDLRPDSRALAQMASPDAVVGMLQELGDRYYVNRNRNLISRGDRIDDAIIAMNKRALVFPTLNGRAFSAKFLRGEKDGEIVAYLQYHKPPTGEATKEDVIGDLLMFLDGAEVDLQELRFGKVGRDLYLLFVMEGFSEEVKQHIYKMGVRHAEPEDVFEKEAE